MTFRIQVAGGPKLDKVAADLKRGGKQLRPKLTEGLRKPTKKLYDDLRNRLLTAQMPARRTGGTQFTDTIRSKGVRKPAANATRWKVSTSSAGPTAEITFSPSKFPDRIRPLFPYFAGQKNRLRHPVMGRRSRWVSQQIPNVWAPTKQLVPEAQKAAGKAVDDIAAIIAGKR